jgi:AcrR family transcriptional regulator
MVHAELQDERRLTAKGRATRDRILQVAAELILREGLSTLNMDALRKAASVSGSQLAHYFADKQALIRAIVVRQIHVVLDFHRQAKLGALNTFDDFERWIDLNMRYLRRIGYSGTPTYHALAGQLGKSDSATRETLASGYWQWIELLEQAIQQMKNCGVVIAAADSRSLALVIVTYRANWPHADAVRFAVNYLRMFATDPAERVPRPARRPRGRRTSARPS